MINFDNTEILNEKLVAYLDGELSSGDIAELEKAIANDETVRQAYDKLTQLNPPFKAAFDPLLSTPIPDQVTRLIEDADLDASPSRRQRWKNGVVAAALAGLFFGASITTVIWHKPASSVPDWIGQIANYQSLYIRPTVENTGSVNWERIENLMETNLGKKVTVPNLSAAGVDFKRGQLLQVDGKPLIQLAYLPKAGIPVAICIMKDSKNINPILHPQYGDSHGLSYVAWQHGDLKFVLVSDATDDQLREWATQAIAQTADS